MKKPLIFALVGSLAGILLVSFLGPRALAWYFDPPVEMGFNCLPAVEWAMTRLLQVQGLGVLGGFLLGLGVSLYFRRQKDIP